MQASERGERIPFGAADVDACLKGGLLRGTLHEIFAAPAHETAASAFAAALAFKIAVSKSVLWIRQDFAAAEFGELAATGFLELGLDPDRLVLLRLKDAIDSLRIAGDALSCAAFGAVVLEIAGNPKFLDLTASRRLALASAEHGIGAFLLRLEAEPATSAAETRWHLRAVRSSATGENCGGPAFEAKLERNRHGRTGCWVMEWSCDESLFRTMLRKAAPDSGFVAAAPGDRSLASPGTSAGSAKTA